VVCGYNYLQFDKPIGKLRVINDRMPFAIPGAYNGGSNAGNIKESKVTSFDHQNLLEI
jgi:hypothetical protein